ncbi:MAG: mercury resistance system transport protein MerF [Kofleriaceae bacterium]|nr:mercury resistance system transport protein MerF [Candidatus Methylomirabilis lanthanidiphila]
MLRDQQGEGHPRRKADEALGVGGARHCWDHSDLRGLLYPASGYPARGDRAGGWAGYLDYALFPVLAVCVGLVLLGLARRRSDDGKLKGEG